jgi:epoxyqueuosine reductase
LFYPHYAHGIKLNNLHLLFYFPSPNDKIKLKYFIWDGGYMISLNKYIEKEIKEIILNSKNGSIYRDPLVGFGNPENPLFMQLKTIVDNDHLLPEDFLPGAKSVVSFFIPFKEDIIINNKNHSYVSKEWAVTYIDTNKLINEVVQKIKQKLTAIGINASDNPAKLGFDRSKLLSQWSQRHIAYICGLGTFGINNMLITEEGCGGRYGSFVIDKELDYTPTITDEYCPWKKNRSCGACIKSCPVSALTEEGYDRFKCFEMCSGVNNYYNDLEECDVCGKCLTGPCAFKKP